jgi:hypothetical protein
MKSRIVSILAVFSLLAAAAHPALAQNTVFTYQGQVTDHGTNFTGTGQFKFALVLSTNTSSQADAKAKIGGAGSGGPVTGILVAWPGSGYLTAPTVTVSGGGGSGATATATLDANGSVNSITVNNPGSGYTNLPGVFISPPPDNVIYTTAWSNDALNAANNEPIAAVNMPVANGLFTVLLGDTTLSNMLPIAASLFAQPNLQLRIWFNDGFNGSTLLSPAQRLTPTPYAAFAMTPAGP